MTIFGRKNGACSGPVRGKGGGGGGGPFFPGTTQNYGGVFADLLNVPWEAY